MEMIKLMFFTLCGTIAIVVIITILCIVATFLFNEQYEALFRLRPGFENFFTEKQNKSEFVLGGTNMLIKFLKKHQYFLGWIACLILMMLVLKMADTYKVQNPNKNLEYIYLIITSRIAVGGAICGLIYTANHLLASKLFLSINIALPILGIWRIFFWGTWRGFLMEHLEIMCIVLGVMIIHVIRQLVHIYRLHIRNG